MIAWRGLRVTGRHAPYRVRPYRGCSIMVFVDAVINAEYVRVRVHCNSAV